MSFQAALLCCCVFTDTTFKCFNLLLNMFYALFKTSMIVQGFVIPFYVSLKITYVTHLAPTQETFKLLPFMCDSYVSSKTICMSCSKITLITFKSFTLMKVFYVFVPLFCFITHLWHTTLVPWYVEYFITGNNFIFKTYQKYQKGKIIFLYLFLVLSALDMR